MLLTPGHGMYAPVADLLVILNLATWAPKKTARLFPFGLAFTRIAALSFGGSSLALHAGHNPLLLMVTILPHLSHGNILPFIKQVQGNPQVFISWEGLNHYPFFD